MAVLGRAPASNAPAEKSGGNHTGRSTIDARASCDVGTPYNSRLWPTVREKRTSHWSRLSSSLFGRSLSDSARYAAKTRW